MLHPYLPPDVPSSSMCLDFAGGILKKRHVRLSCGLMVKVFSDGMSKRVNLDIESNAMVLVTAPRACTRTEGMRLVP